MTPQLRKYYAEGHTYFEELPEVNPQGLFEIMPYRILQERTLYCQEKLVNMGEELIELLNPFPTLNLEDKVALQGGGIVRLALPATPLEKFNKTIKVYRKRANASVKG